VSNPAPEGISEIRRKIAEVEFRAKSEALYFKRLQDDPEQVLREEGFDEPTAREFLAQLRGERDNPCGDFCDGLTCIITSCCFFTLNPAPDPVQTKA
jgi:hypothetical protein